MSRSSARAGAIGYLSEIDGLRALAVLSVLAYHLSSSLLPGGFTGVDVFFVISGYVVSKSLADRPAAQFLAYLLNFYGRRMVRLLPALIVCLLAASLLTVLFIPASWLSQASRETARAAYFGISNFALILSNDGYFSPRVEYNPFVHTWSLAVEEQFYLVFPLLLFVWIASRRRGGWRAWAGGAVLPALALASLGAAYRMGAIRPDWAFYLLPARFWELAAGAMLYQAHAHGRLLPKGPAASLVGLAGGLGLALTGFWLSRPEQFPWPWALPTVLGTVAMIACVARPDLNGSVLHGFLRHPAMAYAGKLSYSLYLWHWPVFALFRWTVGLEGPAHMLLASGVAVLLAAGSYHFVEQAVRQSAAVRSRHAGVKLAAGIAAAMLAFWATGWVFAHRERLSLSVTRDTRTWYAYPAPIAEPLPSNRPFKGRRLFLVGNSHADAYRPMVSEAAQRLGFEMVDIPNGWCAVGNLLYPIDGGTGCTEMVTQTFATIERSARPGDLVFLASLRAHRLVDQWVRFDVPALAARIRSPEGEAGRLKALDEAAAVVARLREMGLWVLIDAPKPVFPAPTFRCSDWFNRANPICAGGLEADRAFLLQLREPVMRSIATLHSRFDNVITWDPFPIFCPGEICSPFDSDGKPMFFDGDHMSGHGNRVLYPAFERLLLDSWRTGRPG